MSWTNECVECDEKISDDYEYCYDCNQEEIPVVVQSIETVLPKSWIFKIRGTEVQLPMSECTFDEAGLKVWVPRWLAVKKEIDFVG